MSLSTAITDPRSGLKPLQAPGAATGAVRRRLQLEGFAVFAGAVAAYLALGYSAWFFGLLALAPDLTFLAYLAGPRAGAVLYNAAHASVGPVSLGVAATYWASRPPWPPPSFGPPTSALIGCWATA